MIFRNALFLMSFFFLTGCFPKQSVIKADKTLLQTSTSASSALPPIQQVAEKMVCYTIQQDARIRAALKKCKVRAKRCKLQIQQAIAKEKTKARKEKAAIEVNYRACRKQRNSLLKNTCRPNPIPWIITGLTVVAAGLAVTFVLILK